MSRSASVSGWIQYDPDKTIAFLLHLAVSARIDLDAKFVLDDTPRRCTNAQQSDSFIPLDPESMSSARLNLDGIAPA